MRRPEGPPSAASGKAPPRARAPLVLASGAVVVLCLALLAVASERMFRPARAQAAAAPQDMAAEFERRGDFKRAAETLRAAWRAAPTETLRLKTARAFLVAGEEATAIDLLSAPSEGASEDFTRRHLLAEADLRARRFADAADVAAALLADAPGDGSAKLILARVAHGLGDFRKSRALTAETIRMGGPSLAEAWLFRARLALDANDLETARSAAKRAGEAGAGAGELSAIEIEALLRAGDLDKARAGLADFRDAPWGGEGPLAERLATHLDVCAGRFAEAGRRLRDIASLVESAPFGLLFIARVADLSGDVAQGEDMLRTALDEAPANPPLLAASFDHAIAVGRLDHADEIIRRVSEVDPDRAALAAVEASLARGDIDAAANAARAIRSFSDPPSTDAFVFGARCLRSDARGQVATRAAALLAAVAEAKGNERSQTLSAARRLDAETDDAAAALLAGEIYLSAGDDDAAATAFSRARDRAPGSSAARTGLARIAARAGAPEDALKAIPADAALTPGAALNRARALAALGRADEAAAGIAPFAGDFGADPAAAAAALRIFARANRPEDVLAVTEGARSKLPDAPQTVELLIAAGRTDQAAAAARAGLIAFPDAEDRAALYVNVMSGIGRRQEAAEFLKELSAKVGGNQALSSAIGEIEGKALDIAKTPPPDEATARRDYLSRADRARSAAELAAALSRIGEAGAAIRFEREACFWKGDGPCS